MSAVLPPIVCPGELPPRIWRVLPWVVVVLLIRTSEYLLESISPSSRKSQPLRIVPVPTMLLPVDAPGPQAQPAPPGRRAVSESAHPGSSLTALVNTSADKNSIPHLIHNYPLAADEAALIWKPHVGTWLTSNVGQVVDASTRANFSPFTGCPNGCGSTGTCDERLGVCRCSSGSTGPRCEETQRWTCNSPDGRYMWSRCAGECDERYGYCYCGQRATYPDRPLLQCEPIGIEDQVSPWKLDPRNRGERHPWSAIWGRSSSGSSTQKGAGWCDANASVGEIPAAKCACRYDGRDGYLCQHKVAMYCLNQCSFHGRCEHGFCICEDGWWGIDCSIPRQRTAPSAVGTASSSNTHEESRTTLPFAHPGAKQVRPLIYVYEMPQRFTTDVLQRRHDKHFCVHRTYLKGNRTEFAYGIYQGYVLEVLMHEWLLSSPHRTLDPSLADWFYVPVYATCAMAIAIFETPHTQPMTKFRTARASALYMGALEHIRSTLPYWNASGGRDHIWTFGYDEGACFAPKEIWPSLLISHWGNTMSKHNRCTTTYGADRWDPPYDPPTGLPLGSLIGKHPCYDPEKDIVMPSFREMTTFLPEDARQRKRARKNLFFFSGDLGSPAGARNAGPHVSPNYSLGIRQAVYRAAVASNATDVEVIGHLERDWWHVKYHAKMHGSTFCGAFPGDGWSGGISSAIFAGCIPLIIMDGIELPFENVLDYRAFSVRIAEADVARWPAILRQISADRVKQLQVGLAKVRSRFGYSSLARNELRMQIAREKSDLLPYLDALKQANEKDEDALQTVLRILLYRAALRRGQRRVSTNA